MAEQQRKVSVYQQFCQLYQRYCLRYPVLLQFTQFCTVGASGVVVDLGMVHLVYHGITQSMPVARFAGIAIAMVWNFLLNRHITFRSSRHASVLPQFARFVAACSIGAGLNWLISVGLFLYAPWFSGRVARCALAGIVAATGSNFVLAKYFAFRHRKCEPEPMTLEGTVSSAAIRGRSA